MLPLVAVDGVGAVAEPGVIPGPYQVRPVPEADTGCATASWQYASVLGIGAAGIGLTVNIIVAKHPVAL